MKTKRIISRRELFMRAAQLLPIVALASIPVVPALAETVTDCNGACKATCNKGCHGTHKGMCSTCSHGCMQGCKGTCGLGCDGACIGSATNKTTTKPTNKQDSCKCECHKPQNDTIKNK